MCISNVGANSLSSASVLAPNLLMPLTFLVKTQNEQALVGKVP